MSNVFVTGTGREQALGFNFVLRYLEQGDNVIASIRKPSEALEKLKEKYPDTLNIITMDISDSASVKAAAEETAKIFPYIDILINNAVTTSPDYQKAFEDVNLDYIANIVDVDAVGPLRVIQAFHPLLMACPGVAFIANISSESGSIGACYRDRTYDYSMAKCALNMGTMLLFNKYKAEKKIHIVTVHPGWMRTNMGGNAKAPLIPYDHAEKMRKLFAEKRGDFDCPVFIDHDGNEFPW
jgi:NAD(P)-dependent dehydrogenase (short-subunit alcohol dehydrogenase family)